MTAANYPNCVPVVRHNEGELADNPADPGGRTYAGVTQRTYDAWRLSHNLPIQDVAKISEYEIGEIYKEYWRSNDIPDGPDLMQYDGSINSGVTQGVKWLQEAVGAVADGVVGPQTIAAVQAADAHAVIDKMAQLRLDFLHRLPIWKDFGDGWTNRVKYTRAQAHAMVKP